MKREETDAYNLDDIWMVLFFFLSQYCNNVT